MEEEYRKHKRAVSVDGTAGVSTPRVPEELSKAADDDASLKALGRKTPTHIDTRLASTAGLKGLEVPETPIPTIKVSSESDREREHADLQKVGVYPNGVEVPPSPVPEEDEAGAEAGAGAAADLPRMQTPDLEKPQIAQTPTGPSHGASAEGTTTNGNAHAHVSSIDKGKGKLELEIESEEEEGEASKSAFNNKRLCERWLDNLFMVLYEVGIMWPRWTFRALNRVRIRTFECTLSGEQRSHTSRHSTCRTERQGRR